MAKIKIREALKMDYTPLVKFLNNGFNTDFDEDYVNRFGIKHFIAFDKKGAIVGSCSIKKTADNQFELYDILVCENYREDGVSDELIKSAISKIPNTATMSAVTLRTVNGILAEKMFTRNGFTLSGAVVNKGKKQHYIDIPKDENFEFVSFVK